jgi:hypothetical protein
MEVHMDVDAVPHIALLTAHAVAHTTAIAQLEGSMGGLEGMVEGLGSADAALETTAHATAIDTMKGTVGGLSSANATAVAQAATITTLEGTVAELQRKVGGLQRKVDSI